MAGALVLYRDGDPPGSPQPQPTDGVTRLSSTGGGRGSAARSSWWQTRRSAQRKAALEAGITSLASDPTLIVRGVISESGAKRLLEAAE